MRTLLVSFCLMCTAFAAWEQSDEWMLPKGVQVNDLAISNSGELYLLSNSTVLKYESSTKNALLIASVEGSKVLSVYEGHIYVVDGSNRLVEINLDSTETSTSSRLPLSIHSQLRYVSFNKKPYVIVNETNRVAFIQGDRLIGSMSIIAERLATVGGDYGETQAPLYTLAYNRIYAWNGGSLDNPAAYEQNLMYSASHTILDFTADAVGNMYVLFSVSIVVLDSDGNYATKLQIDDITTGSRIMVNPANNNLVVYDRTSSVLQFFTNVGSDRSRDIITLNSNKPNPVDNFTEIEFIIEEPMQLSITVYNLIGEPVKTIASGTYTKGTHRVAWNADDQHGNLVPNGIYFYRLESRKGVAIRQLIVLR